MALATIAGAVAFAGINFALCESNESKCVEIPFANELSDGNMKALLVGDKPDQKVLISRYQGKLYATGNACSHFGVPLEGGMLFDDKVLCPAHAAGFSVVTGDPERAPGLDGIPTFKIIEKSGKFYVEIPAGGLPKPSPVAMTKRDPANTQNFVIIGGGAAGLNAAETLRQSGYTGQITMVSNENILPYDRTLITKALTKGDADKWTLRPADYLANADIDVRLNSSVKNVNTGNMTVALESGESIAYDKLLIATGSSNIKPNICGIDSHNVHFIRSNKDQATLKQKCQDAKNIVVIGSGFIGCETASCLGLEYAKDGHKNVHLVSGSQYPLQHSLGKEIGQVYKSQHE